MKLHPKVAGQFYPIDSKHLSSALESMEGEFEPVPLKGDPVGMLLPHAGYPYSGAVAALGYRSLARPVKTVIIAGPSDFVSFRGAALFAGESVVTPLGEIPVDVDVCEFLMSCDKHIAEFPPAFAREHSVEVHFPLVQKYLPDAKVVPIVLGQGNENAVQSLAEALAKLPEKEILFIASSDLCHFPDYEIAKKADEEFLEALLTGDEKKVEETDRRLMSKGIPDYHCTHCGKEPVAALLRFASRVGARDIQLLAKRNSGDVTGDHSRVVGYAAVAFCKVDRSVWFK
jgi:AmmeMemoRadiSam system protein B